MTMERRPRALAAALAWILTVGSTRAAPPALTAEQARAAAEEIARLVEGHYVFKDQRQTIAKALRDGIAAQRYEAGDPAELGARLTDDLRAAGHDRHLWVHWDPEQYQDLLKGKPDSGASEYQRTIGLRRNQGFEEMKILAGNVRYARITNFLWTNDVTGRVIDETARFLGDGDAVIVDLRHNGGGDASAVERLISYFFDGGDRVLMTFHDGASGEAIVTRVSKDLAAPRMVGKPLYVLIDGGTGSAAEEFAYHVQQFKLGVLVGDKTAGAANNNRLFPVAPGFVASVSEGRPVHPVSKTNWEGVGVEPDVASTAALDQAQALALEGLIERAGAAHRSAYEWTLADVESRLHPLKLSRNELRAYAGSYGIRTIRLTGDTLVFQRQGGEPTTLIPMAPDLFAFANTTQVRVRFRRSGDKVIGFDQITEDDQVIPSERTD
jgi:hypothetical protein